MEEKQSGQDPHSTKESRREGGDHGLGHPPKARDSSHLLVTPVLGSGTGKMSPLSWLESQWSSLESCKKSRLCSWSVHMQTCLLPVTTQRQKSENYLELWTACQACHRVPPPAHTGLLQLHWSRDCHCQRDCVLGESRTSRDAQLCLWSPKRNPLLACPSLCTVDRSKTSSRDEIIIANECLAAHIWEGVKPTLLIPTQPLTEGKTEIGTEVQPPNLRPWGCPKPRQRLPSHPGETALPWSSCFPPWGPTSGCDSRWAEEKLWLTPGSGLSPSNSSRAFHQGSSYHTPREDTTCAPLTPSPPITATGTHRLHRDVPTQGRTFKTGIGNCFT